MEQTAQPLVPLRARGKANLYDDVYPESWYAVAPSRTLRRGALVPFEAFGQKWLLARTESGVAQATSRFCPHMGASLHTGFVKGERVVCPFHRWEYENGVCKAIPYLQDGKVPPGARLQTVPLREHLGYIWIYNGTSPSHELPDIPEAHDPEYAWRAKSAVFDIHPLLVLENGCDTQHFKYVHGVDFIKYEIEMLRDEEHSLGFRMHKTVRGWFGREVELTTTIEYAGASAIFGTVSYNRKTTARFVAAPLPLSAGKILYHLIVWPRQLPVPIPGLNALYQSWFARRLYSGALDDYGPIWSQMDPESRGVMVEEDTLQLKFRRYYRAHLPAARVE